MAVLYGALSEKDLGTERVTTVGVDVVMDAIEQSFAEHDRQLRAMMGLFVMPTQKWKTRFQSAAAARLQPLDAAGRARPIKPSGYWEVAFPIQMAGAAWGVDYVTNAKMTVDELRRIVVMMQEADIRWMRDHILAALFFDGAGGTPWTFTDPLNGSLSIYGLADGDTVTYQVMNGADVPATDDHVKGTGSFAVATIEDIFNELDEHPENAGEKIVFVPTASRSTIEGFAGFVPAGDPNIRLSVSTDQLVGSLETPIPGRVFGYLEKCWMVEWRHMPSNYLIGVTTQGDKPLAMREDEEPELRGFHKAGDRNDHPWYEQQWNRRAGFGAWNRVGAIVYETDNATYSSPSGYSSPMP